LCAWARAEVAVAVASKARQAAMTVRRFMGAILIRE
jgi:hypothetical protein